ncbi:hypothetical protein [Streptomyces sp. NPDC002619]|uniref:hypothetical protein n=1 Tax=Streptomyces sp. NPDC002619 TaxID=3364655 RepID=UPI0036C0FB75
MVDEEIKVDHVEPLDTRIPYSMRIRQIAASATPWDSDWSVFAEMFAPAWSELRERLSLPRRGEG